jgi:hypothetical protein
LLILSFHIFFSQDSAFEGLSLSKSFLFLSSESHAHSHYLDFTSITKHVLCVSDDFMDWTVKIIHLLNSLMLIYFSKYAFYRRCLRSSPKVKDHLTRLQKTTETDFYVLLTVHLDSILGNDQLDALFLNVFIDASTCFEQQVLIIRRAKLY